MSTRATMTACLAFVACALLTALAQGARRAPRPSVFWAESDNSGATGIRRGSLPRTGSIDVADGVIRPRGPEESDVVSVAGMAYDSSSQRVYWTAATEREIWSVPVAGGEPARLDIQYPADESPDGALFGVAVDSRRRKLYFAEQAAGRIWVVDLDATIHTASVFLRTAVPTALAFDERGRRLYWAVGGDGTGTPIALARRVRTGESGAIEPVQDVIQYPCADPMSPPETAAVAVDTRRGVIAYVIQGQTRVFTAKVARKPKRHDCSLVVSPGAQPSGLSLLPGSGDVAWGFDDACSITGAMLRRGAALRDAGIRHDCGSIGYVARVLLVPPR